MVILDKIKNILFGEDTSNYELSLQEMKDSLRRLIEEYNNLVDLQDEFKKNSQTILNIEFYKKEKYPDIMDKIKYKDVDLIKEYELYAMKYNILVELYNKVKKCVSEFRQDLLIDFKVDKFKQSVAILSQYKDEANKILLVKNTFANNDYLYYRVGNNIEITDIYSVESNVNHGSFMIEMLVNTVKFLNNNKSNIKEIIVAKELTDKDGFEKCSNYFKKQGFMVKDGVIRKKID